jgi:hypothetical protein
MVRPVGVEESRTGNTVVALQSEVSGVERAWLQRLQVRKRKGARQNCRSGCHVREKETTLERSGEEGRQQD